MEVGSFARLFDFLFPLLLCNLLPSGSLWPRTQRSFLEFGFSVVNFGRAAAVLENLALSIICMDLIGFLLDNFL